MADRQESASWGLLTQFALPASSRIVLLLIASLLFYVFCEPLHVIQLLLATAFVFFIALKIDAAAGARRKRLVKLAVLLTLSNLLIVKYTDVTLPVGISFYTLQLIAYIVDVHRGERPERSFPVFALFVTFVPKLIAGPIERGRQLLPQLRAPAAADLQQIRAGLQLLLWGALKKLVVADRLAPFVDRVYDSPHGYDGVAFTIATWLYAFQIYCDFSGYADMARGAAGMLGVRLAPNFARPYFATSIKDFWKRWHISLSSWLTDYIYTPLSLQRRVRISFFYMMLAAILITFIVSGIWHGAQWKFVAWGALHGAFMVGYVLLQRPVRALAQQLGIPSRSRIVVALKIVLTFNLVCAAYVVFRASSLQDAGYIFSHLLDGWSAAGATIVSTFARDGVQLGLGCAGAGLVLTVEALALERVSTLVRWIGIGFCAAAAIFAVLAYGADTPFIYSRF